MGRIMASGAAVTKRVGATVELPGEFFEAVFSGFEVTPDAEQGPWVRYAVGGSGLGCYLPFEDHRPGVVDAAAACEQAMTPAAAVTLLANLRGPCAVEVRVDEPSQPVVTLWPAGTGRTGMRLAGRRCTLGGRDGGTARIFSGTEVLWHWTGVLPPSPRGGATAIHVSLETIPPDKTRKAQPPRAGGRPRPKGPPRDFGR